MSPEDHETSARLLRTRYPGICVGCGTAISPGTEAWFDSTLKTLRCHDCRTEQTSAEPAEFDRGVAGASARREAQRRASKREATTKARFGTRLGGLILAVRAEPDTTRAWRRGAEGEEALAAALVDLSDVVALHDRRAPGTRGNVDHIVIGPAGVFVVDAKLYRGTIRIRDRGGLFRSDKRLYVGRRDCSELADKMGWQVDAVATALNGVGLGATPVTPVLCFVDGDWSLLSRPNSYKGVHVEGLRSIRRLITKGDYLDSEKIGRVGRGLAIALPPK